VIIRGRGQTELDTLLPIFANLVERNTPLSPTDFDSTMIRSLGDIFPGHSNKTLRNYLTETIGQLFSMFYSENGQVEIAPLTLKLIEDGDQPAFFKVLISRLQFPNPSAKKHKYDEEVEDGLNVKPLVLVLDLLRVAHHSKDKISFSELAFFVLNSMEALTGAHTGDSLYKDILRFRSTKRSLPTFSGSAARQHIKESLNLLILANLIRSDSIDYWINQYEIEAINKICESGISDGLFRHRNPLERHDEYQQAWKKHATSLKGLPNEVLSTQVTSLGGAYPQRLVAGKPRRRATDIGREGELLVLDLENQAIDFCFPGKGWAAQDYTARRGIGFDIESIFCDEPKLNGTPHRIEVKSTLRVTKPDLKNSSAPDGFTLTRSERQAVDTYGETLSIYRVYIFAGGFNILVLRNPSALNKTGKLNLLPDTWSASYQPAEVADQTKIIEEEAL
jgi:Restriction endonuclease BpuJI - N terminal